MIWAAQLSTK